MGSLKNLFYNIPTEMKDSKIVNKVRHMSKIFIDHIDAHLPEERGNKLLYDFKRLVLEEMNQEFEAASSRGITNDKVIADLVISKHTDLEKEYKDYCYSENVIKKRKLSIKWNVIGSVIYIILINALFVGVGLVTHIWSPTWLITVDGILIWVAYLLSLLVNKISQMKRLYHIFARIFLAIDVMVVSVAVFLFALSCLNIAKSWLIIISGIAAMFVADSIFIAVKKQRLAILNLLLYIPAFFTMLFIITCAAGVFAWNTGWKLIIVGLFVDLAVILISLYRNKKYKEEVYSSWNED